MPRLSRPRFAQQLVASVLVASVLTPAFAQQSDHTASGPQIDNPELFRKSLRAAVQSVEQFGIYDNPEEAERVNRIGYQIAQQTDYVKAPFTFTLVDMPIPNAFALPTGQIFITRGMLDLGLDDEMLAALLGHEVAHVTQEHFLRMKKKANLLNALSTLVMAGAVYATANSSDDTYLGPYGATRDNSTARLAQGAMQASMLATELLMRGYSRNHEDEADEEGQRLAAGAGYDPDGARRLMERMEDRMPQAQTYGYLQTHPFLANRARAAEARKASFTVADAHPDTDLYRTRTQRVLLDYLETPKLDPAETETLERSSLSAWPKGDDADRLRLARLDKLREELEGRMTLSRDYGELIDRYKKEIDELERLSADSALIPRLRNQIGEFRVELSEIYEIAQKTLAGGVYEIPFLETFQSNFPDAKEATKVALELGTAYSRLGRETDAIENLLLAWELDGDGEIGKKAQTGLTNLAPVLDQLGGLEILARQEQNDDLRELAISRLDAYASKYKQISNGADYLKRFPDGLYAPTVTTRLEDLADALYREMVLYQQVGEATKAVDLARQILEHAPLTRAAERLSEDTVEESL